MRFALALVLLASSASAAPTTACEDDSIPIDGGMLLLHDCVLDTRHGKTPEFDEHARIVTLRYAPTDGKAVDTTLGGVRDGFNWRERWRVVTILKDETAPNSQAIVLARETGADTGDLCELEIRAITSDLPVLWESSALWAGAKLETERTRMRVRGKHATPASDLDELEAHGKTITTALALRNGRIVDISREKWR